MAIMEELDSYKAQVKEMEAELVEYEKTKEYLNVKDRELKKLK